MLDKKAVSYHIPAALMQMADSVGLYQADADMFFLAKDELAPELVGRRLPYEEVRGYYDQMFVFDSEASRVLTSLCSENLRRMLEERAGARTVSIRVLDQGGHPYWLEIVTEPVSSNEVLITAKSLRRVEREARLDPLTGVLNARAGRETASRRVERLDGTYTGLLAIFDLDEFKSVNDVYGHQVGDRVLQEFSKALVTVFRSEDTVYRLGGDEFAVYMESRRDPRRVAESVMARFYCVLGEHEVDGISIKASVGIFASPRPHDFGEFYSRADACLYKSKSSGRGRWNLDVEERGQP